MSCPGTTGSGDDRGQAHRHRDPPAQHAGRPADGNPRRREVRKPSKQPAQADLAFGPRQRSADTVVPTAGEGEVPPGIASGDVERMRIGEHGGITIRGGKDRSDRLAGADRLSGEFGVPPAYPGSELNGGFRTGGSRRPHSATCIGFASRTRSCSGWSSSRRTPLPSRFTVVSNPATSTRPAVARSSRSVRWRSVE